MTRNGGDVSEVVSDRAGGVLGNTRRHAAAGAVSQRICDKGRNVMAENQIVKPRVGLSAREKQGIRSSSGRDFPARTGQVRNWNERGAS